MTTALSYEKWTRAHSSVISAEALDMAGHKYDRSDDGYVLVHQDLTQDMIRIYAAITKGLNRQKEQWQGMRCEVALYGHLVNVIVILLRNPSTSGDRIEGYVSAYNDFPEKLDKIDPDWADKWGDEVANIPLTHPHLRHPDAITNFVHNLKSDYRAPIFRPFQQSTDNPLKRLIGQLKEGTATKEQYVAYVGAYFYLLNSLHNIDSNWASRWGEDIENLPIKTPQFKEPDSIVTYVRYCTNTAAKMAASTSLLQQTLALSPPQSSGGHSRASTVTLASTAWSEASSNWPERNSRARLSFQGARWEQSIDATTVSGFSALPTTWDKRRLSSLVLPLATPQEADEEQDERVEQEQKQTDGENEERKKEAEKEKDKEIERTQRETVRRFTKMKVGKAPIPALMLKALTQSKEAKEGKDMKEVKEKKKTSKRSWPSDIGI